MVKHRFWLGLLILAAYASSYFFTRPQLESDASVIARFHERRPAFDQLVKMLNQDSSVLSVDEDFVSIKGNPSWQNDDDPGFNMKRWGEYTTLFDHLGSNVHRVSVDRGQIRIASASIAVFETDDPHECLVISKGYLYSQTEPAQLVDSPDYLECAKAPAYKKIDENWYLYLDCGVSKPE